MRRLSETALASREPVSPGEVAPPATRRTSVTVVVPAHKRPVELRRALHSIVTQRYDGDLDVIVVYDRSDPDQSLQALSPGRPVRVMTNTRTPGLAGARNTGILAATGALVAFCDDDDAWQPGKLAAQVTTLESHPGAEFATTAMVIDYGDRSTVRRAGMRAVQHRDLVRSRMAMLHSSSFLVRRSALLEGIGLVDETLPESMAEDWDLLLRAARRAPIAHLDEPLVRVQWGATSYFADQWQRRNEARLWMLEHHPEIAHDRVALGLTYGKLAFGSAALTRRREAVSWAVKALRTNWREPRTPLALAVAARLVSWQRVVRELNKRGHGI
jgi:glycosyltransferase involved in cell wall biosynthesis